MKSHHSRRLLTALLLGAALHTADTYATTANWLGGGGNWSDPTLWSTNPTFPNGGSFDVLQSGGTPLDAITVNQAITIGNYTFQGSSKNTGAGFDLTINGLFSWTGGDFNGTGNVNANGGMTYNGNRDLDGRTLNVGGTSTTASFTTLFAKNGATISNSGTWTFNGNSTISSSGTGANTFNNSGTVTNVGTSKTDIDTVFNNTGTVNANGTGSGVLNLQGGGTHTGSFTVGSGGTLAFSGTHAVNAGSSFTVNPTGTVSVVGGTTTVTPAVTIAGITKVGSGAGATLTFNDTATLNTVNLINGGTLNGTGVISASGLTSWASAKIVGTTSQIYNANGGVNYTGGSGELDGRTVNVSGTSTTATFTTLTVKNGATLNNSGTWTFDSNSTISTSGTGTKTFNNSGTLTKIGAAKTDIDTVFSNTGTVNATSSTLNLQGGVTQHSGTTLTGGTWNVTNGAAINITTGSNITTNGPASTVMLDGAGSSFNRLTAALNDNQGSFTLKNDRDITTTGAYANSGTTRVEDSTTVMTIGAGGTAAYTQSGPSSVTILAGGAMIDTSAFNLNGGSLQGTGTIDGPLNANSGNATTIAPGASPGTITVNGSTVLGANNTLAMEVGGLASGIDYDLLAVNGILTLGGLLDVDFINGFQNSVVPGDVFTIATATSPILGAFSNVASGSRISTNTIFSFEVWYGAGSPYGANNLVLTQAPEPSRALLMVVGFAGIVLRRRRR